METANKKKKLIILSSLLAIILVIGLSYAYLSITVRGEKTNVIKVGSLEVTLDEQFSNGISIENGYAITDEEGLATEKSTFSIDNNGNSIVCYQVYLDDMELNEDETRVDDRFVKFSLDKWQVPGEPKVLTSIGQNPNRLLTSGNIASGSRVEYSLRMWFNADENGNYSGQVFKGKLRVEALQCNIKNPVTKAYSYNSTEDFRKYADQIIGIDMVHPKQVIEEMANSSEEIWDISEKQDGSIIAAITYGDVADKTDQGLVLISGPYLFIGSVDRGNIKLNQISNGLFSNMPELREIIMENVDTSDITDMSHMFAGDSNLQRIDLESFDTSGVINMEGMFEECSNLTTLDLSSFDTSNVTAMGYMFSNCSNLTTLDLSSFNTSRVDYMDAMFYMCKKLTSITVSTLWDTRLAASIHGMEGMFYGCGTDHVTVAS